MTSAQAEATTVLAANQGLYNGFLAAGLFWSLIHPDPAFAYQIKLFFLGAVGACRPIWGRNGLADHCRIIQALQPSIAG
jgi:putative membrane protein